MTEPAAPPAGDGGLVRLRLDLGYDGTAFSGWASQPGLRTVQDEVEIALRTVLRQPELRATCAGRTDAGVHARGQVVHVDVSAPSLTPYGDGLIRLGRRLSGVLPPDVGLRGLARAPAGFDARFSPVWRRYAYRLSDADYGPDPLRRHDVHAHPRRLDVTAMDAAAQLLRGERDFAAYCRRREGATTVRTLLEFSWSRLAATEESSAMVVARVVADAFCHSMVRGLVGACTAVGEGRRDVDWPAQLLAARERASDVPVIAARGLTLEEVRYPEEADLAARADTTRRRRDPVLPVAT